MTTKHYLHAELSVATDRCPHCGAALSGVMIRAARAKDLPAPRVAHVGGGHTAVSRPTGFEVVGACPKHDLVRFYPMLPSTEL